MSLFETWRETAYKEEDSKKIRHEMLTKLEKYKCV